MSKITGNNKKILAILMFNIFIVMVGVGLITPIMPQLIIEFGASGQSIGLMVAANGITQFLLSPQTGQMSDRYGRKTFIIACGRYEQCLYKCRDYTWSDSCGFLIRCKYVCPVCSR